MIHYALTFQQSEQETCTKAYKQYSKSRPAPSPESVKRMKEMSMTSFNCHPLLGKLSDFLSHDVTFLRCDVSSVHLLKYSSGYVSIKDY